MVQSVDDETRVAFLAIQEKRQRPWQGEEEVRIAWVSALETTLGVHFDAERARKDSSYHHLIIEFKAPGLFNGSKASAKFQEATERRLLPYIQRAAATAGIPEEDFIGIAIDGEHVCFARVQHGVLVTEHLIPFSEYAVGLVVQAVLSDTRRDITVENLLADFGHGSATACGLMQSLSDALAAELTARGQSKIKMLFEEWRTLYGQVADMSRLQVKAVNQEIGFTWSGPRNYDMSGRLFVIHTYNSLLIKLLAAEILSAHGLTVSGQPAQAMAGLLDDVSLLDTLFEDIERGGLFSQANVLGFVEEAIFGWYVDIGRHEVYGPGFLRTVRRVLGALSLYRTERLPNTRDVLRDLYQGLVPRKLRQSLGEFYTPDWLVECTVDRASSEAWLLQRVLDPTCGSGSFLLEVLRRKKREAKASGWGAQETIRHLCTSVWGFDLNPLAVQTSRVNFLMELAELLQEAPGTDIEIPVLLADAIYSPAPNPSRGQEVVEYKIGSQVAKLDILLPAALAANRQRLDQVFQQMSESVERNLEYSWVEERLLAVRLVSVAEIANWSASLEHTYNQVLSLHRRQWNGIWFRVVRNFFWSATAGRFDCIVGNPPWVRWSKLPEMYRIRVKPTCEAYGIFSATKYHGGNELDISAMITYTTADKWLRLGGRLAFVLTGTLFKNPSSAGFRTFRLLPGSPESPYLAALEVDDLKALQPFEGVANHTTVAVFLKTSGPGTYPVPYRLWGPATGSPRTIPARLSADEVMERVRIESREAIPVDAIGSPWAVLRPGRHVILQHLAGKSPWFSGRKGITCDLNGVYFVPVIQYQNGLVQIRSRPDAGRKSIGPARTAWIEPDLLFPLIKGAGDFAPCYLRLGTSSQKGEHLFAILPNLGISEDDYEQAEMHMDSPDSTKTKAWFSRFRAVLEERSTYRRQMAGAPFYAVYNVGSYTLQPWKVIWPEMSTRFYAAVAGSAEVPGVGARPYVPDHKIYFVGFQEKEPAYFLCGLLNAPMVREWVESHTISIQVGNIFKHLQLPHYDAERASHTAFARLVERVHQQHDDSRRSDWLQEVERDGEEILVEWFTR